MDTNQIRLELRVKLRPLFQDCQGARLIDELEVCGGKARVDLAIISEELIGIEIKGPKDKLDRLPNQIKYYSKCFDKVILVVDEALSTEATALIPRWWGIVLMDSGMRRNHYTLTRKPQQNKLVDVETILALLWRSEIEELFVQLLGCFPPSRSSKREMREILHSKQSRAALKATTIEILRNRQDWRSFSIDDDLLPMKVSRQRNMAINASSYP